MEGGTVLPIWCSPPVWQVFAVHDPGSLRGTGATSVTAAPGPCWRTGGRDGEDGRKCAAKLQVVVCCGMPLRTSTEADTSQVRAYKRINKSSDGCSQPLIPVEWPQARGVTWWRRRRRPVLTAGAKRVEIREAGPGGEDASASGLR